MREICGGIFQGRFHNLLISKNNTFWAPQISRITFQVVFTVIGSQEMSQGHIRSEAGWTYYLLVALPSMAMGLQNATLTHFGPLTIRTTHVTGTLSNLADELVQYLVWLKGHTGSAGRLFHAVRASRAQPCFRAA